MYLSESYNDKLLKHKMFQETKLYTIEEWKRPYLG